MGGGASSEGVVLCRAIFRRALLLPGDLLRQEFRSPDNGLQLLYEGSQLSLARRAG